MTDFEINDSPNNESSVIKINRKIDILKSVFLPTIRHQMLFYFQFICLPD